MDTENSPNERLRKAVESAGYYLTSSPFWDNYKKSFVICVCEKPKEPEEIGRLKIDVWGNIATPNLAYYKINKLIDAVNELRKK